MLNKISRIILLICFFSSTLMPIPKAQAAPGVQLPAPGTMVHLSPAYEPALIKGLTIHKDNPFLFDFILDTGNDSTLSSPNAFIGDPQKERLKKEGDRLVKYFFAALTIPEKDLWVNLSPYEKDRIIPQALSETALGQDLLAQDYILKQVTASLIYPEKRLGQEFWDRIYAKSQQMFGTTQIPVNTFNKVWILADKATIHEHNQTAFVINGYLKVMLEEDYIALSKNQSQPGDMFQKEQQNVSPSTLPTSQLLNAKAPQGNPGSRNVSPSLSSQIIKEIIIPELEKEVNTGKNFATLRQIFNSQILATWYKQNLKEALLNQVYADKATIKGLETINQSQPGDMASAVSSSTLPSNKALQPKAPQVSTESQPLSPQHNIDAIYNQYLQAYKKGVFNYIKEEPVTSSKNSIGDPNQKTIPRKYFSGGYVSALRLEKATPKMANTIKPSGNFAMIHVATDINQANAAMITNETFAKRIRLMIDGSNGIFTSLKPLGNGNMRREVVRVNKKRERFNQLVQRYSKPNEGQQSLISQEEDNRGVYRIFVGNDANRKLYFNLLRDMRLFIKESNAAMITEGERSAILEGIDQLALEAREIFTYQWIYGRTSIDDLVDWTGLDKDDIYIVKWAEHPGWGIIPELIRVDFVLPLSIDDISTSKLAEIVFGDEDMRHRFRFLEDKETFVEPQDGILGRHNAVIGAMVTLEEKQELNQWLIDNNGRISTTGRGGEVTSTGDFHLWIDGKLDHAMSTPELMKVGEVFTTVGDNYSVEWFKGDDLPVPLSLVHTPNGFFLSYTSIYGKEDDSRLPIEVPQKPFIFLGTDQTTVREHFNQLRVQLGSELQSHMSDIRLYFMPDQPVHLYQQAVKKAEDVAYRLITAFITNLAVGGNNQVMLESPEQDEISQLVYDLFYFTESFDLSGLKRLLPEDVRKALEDKMMEITDESVQTTINNFKIGVALEAQIFNQDPETQLAIPQFPYKGIVASPDELGVLLRLIEQSGQEGKEQIAHLRKIILDAKTTNDAMKADVMQMLESINLDDTNIAKAVQGINQALQREIFKSGGYRIAKAELAPIRQHTLEFEIAENPTNYVGPIYETLDYRGEIYHHKLRLGKEDLKSWPFMIEYMVKGALFRVLLDSINKGIDGDFTKRIEKIIIEALIKEFDSQAQVPADNAMAQQFPRRIGSGVKVNVQGVSTLAEVVDYKPTGRIKEFDDEGRSVNRWGRDDAMNANYGGIDLNSANMGMTVTKDANGGVKVNFDPVMIERIQKEGVRSIVPMIINVTPMTMLDIRPLLGLAPSREEEEQIAKG